MVGFLLKYYFYCRQAFWNIAQLLFSLMIVAWILLAASMPAPGMTASDFIASYYNFLGGLTRLAFVAFTITPIALVTFNKKSVSDVIRRYAPLFVTVLIIMRFAPETVSMDLFYGLSNKPLWAHIVSNVVVGTGALFALVGYYTKVFFRQKLIAAGIFIPLMYSILYPVFSPLYSLQIALFIQPNLLMITGIGVLYLFYTYTKRYNVQPVLKINHNRIFTLTIKHLEFAPWGMLVLLALFSSLGTGNFNYTGIETVWLMISWGGIISVPVVYLFRLKNMQNFDLPYMVLGIVTAGLVGIGPGIFRQHILTTYDITYIVSSFLLFVCLFSVLHCRFVNHRFAHSLSAPTPSSYSVFLAPALTLGLIGGSYTLGKIVSPWIFTGMTILLFLSWCVHYYQTDQIGYVSRVYNNRQIVRVFHPKLQDNQYYTIKNNCFIPEQTPVTTTDGKLYHATTGTRLGTLIRPDNLNPDTLSALL